MNQYDLLIARAAREDCPARQGCAAQGSTTRRSKVAEEEQREKVGVIRCELVLPCAAQEACLGRRGRDRVQDVLMVEDEFKAGVSGVKTCRAGWTAEPVTGAIWCSPAGGSQGGERHPAWHPPRDEKGWTQRVKGSWRLHLECMSGTRAFCRETGAIELRRGPGEEPPTFHEATARDIERWAPCW